MLDKSLETSHWKDPKFYEDYNSIGIGGVYDLGIGFKLGYYTESEFEVDYLTLGGSIDGIVDLSLKYYYNTDSFHNETLMLSFGLTYKESKKWRNK